MEYLLEWLLQIWDFMANFILYLSGQVAICEISFFTYIFFSPSR